MSDPVHLIRVPGRDGDGKAADIRSTLQAWDWDWDWRLLRGTERLVLDFTALRFMEPWALAMFAAYGLHGREEGIKVELRLDPSNPSNAYLEQMGFVDLVERGDSDRARQRWRTSPQNTGLHQILSETDRKAFDESTGSLKGLSESDELDALRYAMVELTRNVLQHSGSKIGGIAIAQYFPERKALQLAVCDLGRGVRAALEAQYPEIRSSAEALRLAILPHVSGVVAGGPYGAGSDNAGLGLFVCREIAWRASGSFWLASKDAVLGTRGDVAGHDDHEGTRNLYRSIRPWPGTLVAVDIPVAGTLSFQGVLSICRQLAQEARAQSGAAGLDFMDEASELEAGVELVAIAPIAEDIDAARQLRDERLLPRVRNGEPTVLDFGGIRFVTQSFAHALLNEVLRVPGSLVRLSFARCTRSTREVLRAVAGYAASYRRIV